MATYVKYKNQINIFRYKEYHIYYYAEIFTFATLMYSKTNLSFNNKYLICG